VFSKISLSVQYQIRREDVKNSFYILQNSGQIASYVTDAVRTKVSKLTVDELFEQRDEVASVIKDGLLERFKSFGFEIINALVTDVDPTGEVKNAMNRINAAQRNLEASKAEAQTIKVRKIAEAEAEAESKRLQGEGIAKQRKAIIEGLKQSIEDFQKAVPESSSSDVMNLILMIQHYDTLKEVGAASPAKTIFLNTHPGAVNDLKESLIAANEVHEK